MIGTCAKCHQLWDGSQEDVSAPGSTCPSCWRDGWRPDGVGNVIKVCPHCSGRHPAGCCPRDGHGG